MDSNYIVRSLLATPGPSRTVPARVRGRHVENLRDKAASTNRVSIATYIKFVTADPLSRYAGKMDINKMLADLRTERDQISEAIVVLERLTIGQGKRRGRPPKWLTEVKRRGRPKGSKNKPKQD
jgi:hypothetical protein